MPVEIRIKQAVLEVVAAEVQCVAFQVDKYVYVSLFRPFLLYCKSLKVLLARTENNCCKKANKSGEST